MTRGKKHCFQVSHKKDVRDNRIFVCHGSDDKDMKQWIKVIDSATKLKRPSNESQDIASPLSSPSVSKPHEQEEQGKEEKGKEEKGKEPHEEEEQAGGKEKAQEEEETEGGDGEQRMKSGE